MAPKISLAVVDLYLQPKMPYTPLVPVAPTAPDFHLCNPFYGTNLDHVHCDLAGGQLPIGSNPVVYELRGSTVPYVLPWTVQHGQWGHCNFNECFHPKALSRFVRCHGRTRWAQQGSNHRDKTGRSSWNGRLGH